MEEPSEAAAAVKGTTDGLKLGDVEEKGAVSALDGEVEKTYYVSDRCAARLFFLFSCVLRWCQNVYLEHAAEILRSKLHVLQARVLVLLGSVCC